mgnify:CR=1 FL=1
MDSGNAATLGVSVEWCPTIMAPGRTYGYVEGRVRVPENLGGWTVLRVLALECRYEEREGMEAVVRATCEAAVVAFREGGR